MTKKNENQISSVMNEIFEEEGITRETIVVAIKDSIFALYEKIIPLEDIHVTFDPLNETLNILINKKVVLAPEAENEISFKKAKAIIPQCKVGEIVPFPLEKIIGRVEITKIKQLIGQKIKQQEAENVYKEFLEKKNTIVSGCINKLSENGFYVMVQNQAAFLPHDLTIPGEELRVGMTIRALLKEVYQFARHEEQLLLDRTSPDFTKKLLELEIPELFDGTLTIEKCVRAPGYKTKVIVSSKDQYINAVGTCVGTGGNRIKPITNELGKERIDIIPFSTNLEKMIIHSFKPAEILSVTVIDGKTVQVAIQEDQRSIVIGKEGKNIILTSKLFGVSIEIMERNAEGNFVSSKKTNNRFNQKRNENGGNESPSSPFVVDDDHEKKR